MTTQTELGFPDALVRLSHLVQHVFADVSRAHDLTPQQTQLLCQLSGGPVGMTELGRSLHLEKSSLTGLVDRVERRGLAARTRDSQDRRACRIALTAEGGRVARQAHADVVARLETLASDLPVAGRDQVAAAITTIVVASADRAVTPAR